MAKAPSARLQSLRARAARSNFGALWRKAADAAVAERQYALAADAYRREAAVYRRNGDVQGARAELNKAARFHPAIAAFVRVPASARRVPITGARLEPALGCYVGAFIDRDDTLGRPFLDGNSQPHRNASAFERAVGRPHATYLMYMAYGRPFPWRWANALKSQGQIPHIAWEPATLLQVEDAEYLRRFAEDCARFNHPIFLRFAAEMNGNWTPYHGDPVSYRRAFRTVAAAIHRAAPKAAMLWCPDAQPADTIPAYYPGDDAVDWVGVNFYSVMFYDNDPHRPAGDNPEDSLRSVYDRYAARKPIAIGEWAASHYAQCEGRPRPAFAAEKIARLYAALPRLFPRVKMVNWYDANNLRYADPARRLNNYQLTDDATVRDAYRQAVADPWYLGRADESASIAEAPLSGVGPLKGKVILSACAEAPVPVRVYWSVDYRVRFATARAGAAAWTWDTTAETPGPHRVSVLMFDAAGRFIAAKAWVVRVRR